MRRESQAGLGQGPAQEFAFQIGTLVQMEPKVHPLEGVVTDIQVDEAGQRIHYVRPWGGEAKPYLQNELTPVMGRGASTIDRFLRTVLGSA